MPLSVSELTKKLNEVLFSRSIEEGFALLNSS